MFDWLKNSSRKMPKGICMNSVPIVNAKGDELIKIVPVGSFPRHPNGAHEITKENIKEMAKNLKNSKTDLLYDYGHESMWNMSAIAAGWSPKNSVVAKDDGLYVKYPDFTPNAQEQVDNKEYRYFSPVYRLNSANKKGREIGAQIISVGLTNTPYMDKEIDSIKNSKTEEDMEGKELRKKLGLPEDASDEKVNSKLDELMNPPEPTPAKPAAEESTVENGNKDVLEELNKINSRIHEIETGRNDDKIETEISAGISQYKILPADTDIWRNSFKADFDSTKKRLDAIAVNSVKPGKVNVDNGKDKENKVNSVDAAAEFFRSQGRQPLVKGGK